MTDRSEAVQDIDNPTPEELFTDALIRELERCRRIHPRPFASQHEAFAIIMEEIDEFWAGVKLNESKEYLLIELVQIAAMCARAAADLELLSSTSPQSNLSLQNLP